MYPELSSAPRILVVEDDALVRRTLVRELRDIGELLQAEDAREALVTAQSSRLDLIVSDCEMPGMRGIELLKKMREVYPDTLRMLVSGTADVQEVQQLQADGTVQAYLAKPWNGTALRDAVLALLRQ